MAATPNIVFITADDMNWDAVGAYGCPTAGTTPHLDRLAAEGMRFDHAHVTIAVCQPSRSALHTGRYPHRSGGEGFHHLRQEGVPILPELLRAGGYRTGILGKVAHSTPYAEFDWDMSVDMAALGQGRNPELYARHAAEFLRECQAAKQPFYLMLNSHDPHRPFVGNDPPEWYTGETPAVPPSKTFSPDEVVTPGFLPDLPEVRREIAEYYSSVRRCDDTIGRVLAVLDEAGVTGNTLVTFLSDNGMAFPFAKTNCYLNSTRTPWIVRWPGVVKPGSVDSQHFISGIDFLPTMLEAAGIAEPPRVDGKSYLPLLRGEQQVGRDRVFTQFHQTAGKRNYPMRCVQTRQYGYIFNAWSNGERIFQNESQAGRTMAAMREAAEAGDTAVAERIRVFLYRTMEELYDFSVDPDARYNLIEAPEMEEVLSELRASLEQWMMATEDPALPCFRQRHSVEAREAYMQASAESLQGIA